MFPQRGPYINYIVQQGFRLGQEVALRHLLNAQCRKLATRHDTEQSVKELLHFLL